MTGPREDTQSALTDPDDRPDLLDVAIYGDALDDPAYRALLEPQQ